MINHDYILMLIERLVKFLAQVFFKKKAGNYEDAFLEVESAVKNILGLDYDLINKLSADDIISLTKKNELYYGIKCIIIGKLNKEATDLQILKKPEFNPTNNYLKSLTLMLEGVLSNEYKEVDLSRFYPDIEELDSLLENYNLPDKLYFQLFKFYELIERYDKAADLLFELKVVNYPDILNEGQNFYNVLKTIPNEELQRKNLTREILLADENRFLN